MSYTCTTTDMNIVEIIQHARKDGGEYENLPIPVLPVAGYQTTITVKQQGNPAVVTWKAAYYRGDMNYNPPVELSEAAADRMVTGVLKAGLTSLLHSFEPNTSPTAITFQLRR